MITFVQQDTNLRKKKTFASRRPMDFPPLRNLVPEDCCGQWERVEYNLALPEEMKIDIRERTQVEPKMRSTLVVKTGKLEIV